MPIRFQLHTADLGRWDGMVEGSIELNKIQIQSCVLVVCILIASLHEILKKSFCFKMILVLIFMISFFRPFNLFRKMQHPFLV